MRRKAPWFPFFAADWNGDEQVRLLSLEAQGAYVRLLAHSWIERSIPADPDSIGVLLGERRLGKKLWPALAKFWEPKPGEPGRMVNPRLERERKAQDDYSAEQKERGRSGNESRARMRAHSGREESAPGTVASANASANANASAEPSQVRTQLGSQTSRSVQSESEVQPPYPPSKGGEGRSQPDFGPSADPNPEPSKNGGATTRIDQAPDPARNVPSATVDPEVPALASVFERTGYRRGRPLFVLAKRAAELHREGLTLQAYAALHMLAIQRSNAQDPIKLLAHWLDNALWREVLDEASMKSKELALHARAEAAKPKDILGEIANGIYGPDPKPIGEIEQASP